MPHEQLGGWDTLHMHTHMTEVVNQNDKGTYFTSRGKSEQRVADGGSGSKAEVKLKV